MTTTPAASPLERLRAVRALDLPGVAKAVLFALVLRENTATRDAYPSISTISDDCGFGVSAVKSALATLEQLGLIERVRQHREDGGATSNLYRIMLPAKVETGLAVTRPRGGRETAGGRSGDDEGGGRETATKEPISKEPTRRSPAKGAPAHVVEAWEQETAAALGRPFAAGTFAAEDLAAVLRCAPDDRDPVAWLRDATRAFVWTCDCATAADYQPRRLLQWINSGGLESARILQARDTTGVATCNSASVSSSEVSSATRSGPRGA